MTVSGKTSGSSESYREYSGNLVKQCFRGRSPDFEYVLERQKNFRKSS